MFLQRAALRPIPADAKVSEEAIDAVESSLEGSEDELQDLLDQAFREFDKKQPELAEYISNELADRKDELAQSLGYFLAVAIYMTFREGFGSRLGHVTADALESTLLSLDADETLRASDPNEVMESDDVIAMSQPHLVDFVQAHVQEAIDSAGDQEVNLDDFDAVYRAVLVQIIAFSHAIDAGPIGNEGGGELLS